MPLFKAGDLLFVLAAGLLLWGAQHHRKWDQFVPRPGTRISFPQFHSPRLFTQFHPPSLLPQFHSPSLDWAPDIEVEFGWFAETAERIVWSGTRLAEQVSQGVVSLARGLRSPWNRWTQLAAKPQHLRTVVVDPGHGGRDPGAIGVGGLSEKWVTLRLSRALRSELEARGFRVITTRYGDQTVSLRRRIEIAEQQGGNLFVSLHANAAIQQDVNGIGTYYPDKSYARHNLRVAAGDSGTRAPQLDPAGRPFTYSNFSRTSSLSAELANAVHQRAVSSVRERYRSLSDRGVRSGPFYVLFLSSMPSVLIEVGFLTHQEEATRMQSDTYVSLLAEAIAEGIAGHRDAGDWPVHDALGVRGGQRLEGLRHEAERLADAQRALALEDRRPALHYPGGPHDAEERTVSPALSGADIGERQRKEG